VLTTAALCTLIALTLAAAGSATADDARRAAACVANRGTMEDIVACLAAAAPARDMSPPVNEHCASAPPGPFATPLPGRVILRFGDRTAYGLPSKGVVLQGEPSASVRAPARGVVRYAGPYRSYGNIVVVEVECESHFVFAGVESMVVATGDVVPATQILGNLPAGPLSDRPALYVELHQRGTRELTRVPTLPGPETLHFSTEAITSGET
jgi:septal ring factor EnvC (AmiA/AmiB activator)